MSGRKKIKPRRNEWDIKNKKSTKADKFSYKQTILIKRTKTQ